MLGTSGPNGPAGSDPLREEHATLAAETRRDRRVAWSGWGAAIFACVAIGHGLWAIYGSGEAAASYELVGAPVMPSVSAKGVEPAPACTTYGPFELTPEMNPVRAVLQAGYSPVGSTRQPYEIALIDESGQTLWDRRGTIGNTDDDASFVSSTTPVADFEVERAGTYKFEVSFPEGSMDDLREARLEVRQGVAHVDPRIMWGCGLAALAMLLINLLSPKNEYPYARTMAPEEHREAA